MRVLWALLTYAAFLQGSTIPRPRSDIARSLTFESGIGTGAVVSTTSAKDWLRVARNNPSLLQAAREFVDRSLQDKLIATVKEAHACISIYKLAGGGTNLHLDSALGVLAYLDERNICPDTFLFNNILDMCAKGAMMSSNSHENVRVALGILDQMEQLQVEKDVKSWTSAIQVCANSRYWKKSIELLQNMVKSGVRPDAISISSAIQACTLCGRWKEALSLLLAMRSSASGVALDTILCNNVIAACATAGEWNVALKIMDIMHEEKLPLDAYTFTSAIAACDQGGQCGEVLSLLDKYIATAPQAGLSDAPFNAALNSLLKHGLNEEGVEIYKRMTRLGVKKSEITCTALATGLAKLGQWDSLLQVFIGLRDDARAQPPPFNEAIVGSALKACEKLGRHDVAKEVFRELPGVLAEQPVPTQYYNMLLASYGKAAAHSEVAAVVAEMDHLGVPKNADSFTHIVSSCKTEGRLDEALKVLGEYEASAVYDRSNAYPYAAMISVCVESKQWEVALDVLEKMEQLDIARSKVAINSAIEALDAAGETVRAELVYQTALRSSVYSHWVNVTTATISLEAEQSREGSGVAIMDLHFFPSAVGRAAIMHALGEMLTSKSVADPLVIITGRGKGILKSEIEHFLGLLGIKMTPLDNPGRIKVTKSSLVSWYEAQQEDDAKKRQGGRAHGNLFLSVASAISRGRSVNVKAVCPFSAAQTPVAVPLADAVTAERIEPLKSTGGCPAHAKAAAVVEPVPKASSGVGCPVHAKAAAVVEPVPKASSGGGCPAHAKAAAVVEPVPKASGGGGCPAHAHNPQTV